MDMDAAGSCDEEANCILVACCLAVSKKALNSINHAFICYTPTNYPIIQRTQKLAGTHKNHIKEKKAGPGEIRDRP